MMFVTGQHFWDAARRRRRSRGFAKACLFALSFGLGGCLTLDAAAHPAALDAGVEVVTPDEVNFIPLNPARGDASPQAGVLWGDIRKDEPSGVLLRFADGFSSPPHIHNITYRAVVISGALHNDDPQAAPMWMGPGSYWLQPAGEVHITAARPGAPATAFLEILEGPYLVQPGRRAFDNGERPVNVTDDNLVWLGADDITWISASGHEDAAEDGPTVALLWGERTPGALSGVFVKLAAGSSAHISTADAGLRSVVVQGRLLHDVEARGERRELGPGGYVSSDADITHQLGCGHDEACILYIRTAGRLVVEQADIAFWD